MIEALDTAHSMGVRAAGAPKGPVDGYAKAACQLIERWLRSRW